LSERRKVAVFGSSEPREGEPLYALARELGRKLGDAGFDVVSGGYGGVMEAVSRGAREGGGRTVGVLCSWFDGRDGNRFLDEAVETADLFERTRELIERADAFVILNGKAGTLAELTFLWALHRCGRLPDRPVVLLGDAWTAMVDQLSGSGRLDPSQASICVRAKTPGEVVRALQSAARE
jgi:uncharacterized protein (TIGR00730 family)